MLTSMKGWIINVCSTLFFITAVEMILPSNSMKKYCKFVLGLILMTVIINPFVKFFTGEFNIAALTTNITNSMDGTNTDTVIKRYREESINNTLNIFKINLCKSVQEKLTDEFPKYNFKVSVEASYNKEDGSYILNSLTVNTNANNQKEITTFLEAQLKIKKECIKVLKG
jgi:stage III sporulation protein AF